MARKKRKGMKTYRTFNKKRYDHYTEKASKREVKLMAKNVRSGGELARITANKTSLDGTKSKKTLYHLWVH